MTWWSWMVLGALLLGAELFAIDAQFYLVFLGVSAILVGLASLLGIRVDDLERDVPDGATVAHRGYVGPVSSVKAETPVDSTWDTCIHFWDGAAFTQVDCPLDPPTDFLTVNGCGDEVVAVGGFGNGKAVRTTDGATWAHRVNFQ